MLDTKLPELSFPDLAYGSRQEPIDLRWWLYRGGASVKVTAVRSLVDRGKLGNPAVERIELLELLYAKLRADFVGGGSEETLRGAVFALPSVGLETTCARILQQLVRRVPGSMDRRLP